MFEHPHAKRSIGLAASHRLHNHACRQRALSVMLVLGIEGSANKVGVGIVREDGDILANPRHTCEQRDPS